MSGTLQSIKYEKGKLQILDQLLLPSKSEYVSISGVEEGWQAIHSMQVCTPTFLSLSLHTWDFLYLLARF